MQGILTRTQRRYLARKVQTEQFGNLWWDQSPSKFLHIYTTTVQAAGNDVKVMANNLPTILKGCVRTWLFNQPENSIYNWEHICDAILKNFKSCYTKLGKEDDLCRLCQTLVKIYVSLLRWLCDSSVQIGGTIWVTHRKTSTFTYQETCRNYTTWLITIPMPMKPQSGIA